jgi:hypothetical protein
MTIAHCVRVCTALVLSAVAVHAQRDGNTHLVVISGVSGEPRIGTEWHSMSLALATAATERFGIAASRVILLAQDSTRDAPRLNGRSTKVTIERVLSQLARTLGAQDRLVIVIMAHGSSLSGDARVNLPGPDMTASDFARVLAPATAPSVAFIHTGSASGDFASELAGPRRIIITATKSAREQNETLFPGPFVRALTTDAGDTNKDGRVSLLEAFTVAQQEVEQVFTKGNLLPTEHAVLTDSSDGRGGQASTFYFATSVTGTGAQNSPEIAAALAARAEVQSRIDALRAQRATMDEATYLRALEPLIVELIERTRALRPSTPQIKR